MRNPAAGVAVSFDSTCWTTLFLLVVRSSTALAFTSGVVRFGALLAFPPAFVSMTGRVVQECKVTDQKQTGRCWIFAALNVMRLGMLEKYGLADDFELVRERETKQIFRWK